MIKKCKTCGRPLRDPKFDTCFDCSKKSREKIDKLPDDYLSRGYFDEKGNLYCELITTTAEKLAEDFGQSRPQLKNHQLRRFYNHIKMAENQLNMLQDFPRIQVKIQKLKPFAAEAAGGESAKVPKIFYDFINKNLDLVKDEKSFREGFLEHFQAVVAYFKFRFPRQ